MEPSRELRAVRLWLFMLAGLIFAMVIVGGATRLTQSGLSIVEWKPVTGVLPPVDDSQWQAEFEKYQAIPQFRIVNHTMTVGEFKRIYWWEWGHRLLGRLIGVVFILPLLWFSWRGCIGPLLRRRLWLIFSLGVLQGAAGWWMVASGLSERTSVSQYRLATHLVLACLILAATLWTALGLLPRPRSQMPVRIRAAALALLALVLVQLYLGGLLAGLRGGLVFNTWPLMNDSFVPWAELFALIPGWRNFFENVATVQFEHRMMACAVWWIAACHTLDVVVSRTRPVLYSALALMAGVTLQASLGVATLLQGAPLPLALAHQAMAIMVLASAVIHAQKANANAPLSSSHSERVSMPLAET
jgi:heme a synthase